MIFIVYAAVMALAIWLGYLGALRTWLTLDGYGSRPKALTTLYLSFLLYAITAMLVPSQWWVSLFIYGMVSYELVRVKHSRWQGLDVEMLYAYIDELENREAEMVDDEEDDDEW